MDRLEYNIRLIILGVIGIVGIIAVTHLVIKEGKINGLFPKHFFRFQTITKIVGGIIAIAFLVYTICGVFSKEITASKLRVLDIVCNGSLGGVMDTYTLYLQQDSKKEIVVKTMLFSSKKINATIEQLEKGDIIKIKYTQGTNSLYFVEETKH